MLPTNRPIGLNPDGVRVSRLQNHLITMSMIFNIFIIVFMIMMMKTKVIGVNEWAKTGDKGKPQPDGFTPEGGLVRSFS